ncbi:MAG: YggT family protein [Alphaproteobacteria bacterium]|nr:YggT family protein [Alphaproteobacteria bacterium]
MGMIYWLFSACAQIYILIVFLEVAMNWLIALDIVKAGNDAAIRLTTFLKKATDPVYTPIRKYVPPIGGLDLTPLVVILGIQLLMAFLGALL